ncbi:hypothetical protein [Sphaerisporangium corydalis]|uniref:Uncharacterized protein n=1 Tax=Sphaerisporangium corydalis TaxID=1441875 RepID=A0ABV9EIV4_9ACTN|nr:hypothetical protein [Sphaerisporangium corydalis]
MSDDDYLLAALRIAAGSDPIPARVSADARAVYGLRLPGAVTAVPVGPPPHVGPGRRPPSGTRSGGSGTRSGGDGDPLSGFGADAIGVGGVGRRLGGGGRHGDGAPRLLRFAAGGVTIDVEVTIGDTHIDLAGQVRPAPGDGSRVEIRTPHISKIRFPSETGEFATTGLPHGWLSIVCHRPGLPPVATRWQCLRP